MNLRPSLLILASCVALLTACTTAPQLAVPLAPQAFTAPANSYGVVMTSLPAVDTQFPGAGCLLCIAAASIANSTMTEYTKKLPLEDLPKLNWQVGEALKKRGATVTMIDNIDFSKLPDNPKPAPNFSVKDFSSIKAKYNVDKLLVISISMVGIERNYSSYFPVGDPKARITGTSYIVNLKDNSLEWYVPLDIQKASDGKWDEPPKFPGLTNAYFQALEMTKDQVVNPLLN